MTNLSKLARNKAEAAMQRRIEAISIQIKTINNEHAAAGLLRSGVTLKRSLRICKTAINEQSQTVQKEYLWAANTAIFASQTWINQLVSDAVDSLELLHKEAIKELKKAVILVGTPEHIDRLMAELQITREAANNEITLALHSGFVERSRGLIKPIFGWIPRLIARIFSGT
jgi:hypothetical protein